MRHVRITPISTDHKTDIHNAIDSGQVFRTYFDSRFTKQYGRDLQRGHRRCEGIRENQGEAGLERRGGRTLFSADYWTELRGLVYLVRCQQLILLVSATLHSGTLSAVLAALTSLLFNLFSLLSAPKRPAPVYLLFTNSRSFGIVNRIKNLQPLPSTADALRSCVDACTSRSSHFTGDGLWRCQRADRFRKRQRDKNQWWVSLSTQLLEGYGLLAVGTHMFPLWSPMLSSHHCPLLSSS